MKKTALISPLRALCVLACVLSITSLKAQWLNGPWPGPMWNWNPGPTGCGNSKPALIEPTPWALGGNDTWANGAVMNNTDNSSVNGNNFKTTSIGTINDAPFIMKANNKEAIFIDPGARVGLGFNNNNGMAPISMWSALNPASNQSRLNFYVDKPGHIESDQNMNLLFSTNSLFNIKEGSVSGGSVPRISIINGGKCGINNASPQAALDVQSSTSPSSFRIFGDANGNVHSTTHMKLHFGNFTGAGEFQINDGAPGNAITRMAFNVFGAHIHTGGVFNGLFIGPSTSTWYNNSASTRIWLDAINTDGLVIVGGGGANAMYVANAAGAGRFEMKINAGGGNDTKFKLGGSAQFGFYNSTGVFEDATCRVNVDAYSTDGVKVTTNNNSIKALYVNNSNFNATTPNSFIVYGDGKTQIGPNYPDPNGVANGAMLSVNGMILAKDVRVAIDFGNAAHWKYADYVFEKDYKLMSLSDIEKYVSKHKHLPDVPSEADVTKNGMGLAEMNVALLKKVEELYLHTIDLKKQLDEQAKEISKLKQK